MEYTYWTTNICKQHMCMNKKHMIMKYIQMNSSKVHKPPSKTHWTVENAYEPSAKSHKNRKLARGTKNNERINPNHSPQHKARAGPGPRAQTQGPGPSTKGPGPWALGQNPGPAWQAGPGFEGKPGRPWPSVQAPGPGSWVKALGLGRSGHGPARALYWWCARTGSWWPQIWTSI